MELHRTGIWTGNLDFVPSRRAQELAAELDEQGWGALWIPETVGRDALVFSGLLLAGAPTITVATGIANVWGRDAMAMKAGQLTLAEAYPDRFLLGLGVSHEPLIQGVRHHDYRRPLEHMGQYLDAMDTALFVAPAPASPPPRVLAALGPKMLALAAERADGAHTYLVPPEHTAIARQALGADGILAVEQMVILDTDPVQARTVARQALAMYLTLPNYTNNLKRLGYDEADLGNGGSDRLVDALVAWGDVETIAERVQAHQAAGASHVCIQVLTGNLAEPPTSQWAELAPALTTM
jgi:probable F420-dependent oxidoreductase